MRPIMNIPMCAFAAAALAASAPAFAASADYYLKLGDIKPVLSKVEGGESAARSGSPVPSGADKRIAILSWSWGATNAGRVNLNSSKSNAAKYGAVAAAHRDDTVDPAEKRQHGWMPVAQPLDRGAVRVKVKFPWLDCKVGATFPDAVLQNDAGRYELKEVIISGCAPDEISLNYGKVMVRGWDPAKKEE